MGISQKMISSFPGEALLAAHLFPGKAGLRGSGWPQNIPPQKKPQKRSWILLEDSPGGSRLFAMETERCQRMESPKIPSFWGSGVEPQAPSFPSAWKNRWNGGIRARGAEGFGVGTQQSPPRLNLNLFGIKQTPKKLCRSQPPCLSFPSQAERS